MGVHSIKLRGALAVTLQEKVAHLTAEQRQHMETIMASVRERKGDIFYLDGPGGYGFSKKYDKLSIIKAKVASAGKS